MDESIKVGCQPRRIVLDWPAAYLPDPGGVYYPVVTDAPESCRGCKYLDRCSRFVDDYVAAHRMTAIVDIIYPLGI